MNEDALAMISEEIAKMEDRILYLRGLQRKLAGPGPMVVRGNGTGRREEIAAFILANGPSRRADIISGTGIPPGTVAYVLNDPKSFRLNGGKWEVVGDAKTHKSIRDASSAS